MFNVIIVVLHWCNTSVVLRSIIIIFINSENIYYYFDKYCRIYQTLYQRNYRILTMLVYLTELNTKATYNGIVRSNNDLTALIRNFKRMITEHFGIHERDMCIKIC